MKKKISYRRIGNTLIILLAFFVVLDLYHHAPTILDITGFVSMLSRVSIMGAVSIFFAGMICLLYMATVKAKSISNTAFFVSASALRIWYGELIGMWFQESQFYDDRLMIIYSDLRAYSGGTTIDSATVMLKEMGMPFMLNVVNIFGLPYSAFLSLLWIIDAILVFFICKKAMKRNNVIPRVAFLIVGYTPAAFEMWCGTRLYRNSLLTPLYMMVFSLLFLMILYFAEGNEADRKKICMLSTALGIVFSVTYYTKEDGNWLLATTLFMMIIWIAVVVLRVRKDEMSARKEIVNVLAMITIPLIIFMVSTAAYKSFNYHSFGIYETNARTKGEAGRFVENIYSIDSIQRTMNIWAPADALEKAFASSKTLGDNEALRDTIFHTPWFDGDIYTHPIKGDFLTWVLKDAMVSSGTAATKAESEAYLATVNEELEEAFREGKLREDHRLRTVRGLGGITGKEAKMIFKETIKAYPIHITCSMYDPGGAFSEGSDEISQLASVTANMKLTALTGERAVRLRQREIATANIIAEVLFDIYGILNIVLCSLAVCGIVYSIIMTARDLYRKNSIEYRPLFYSCLALVVAGLSFALLFHVTWFCMYVENRYVLQFFSIGIIPMIIFFELFGTMPLLLRFNNNNVSRKDVK